MSELVVEMQRLPYYKAGRYFDLGQHTFEDLNEDCWRRLLIGAGILEIWMGWRRRKNRG